MAALLESSLHGVENSIIDIHLLPEASQQFYWRMEENHREIQRRFARIFTLLEEEIAEIESAQDVDVSNALDIDALESYTEQITDEMTATQLQEDNDASESLDGVASESYANKITATPLQEEIDASESLDLDDSESDTEEIDASESTNVVFPVSGEILAHLEPIEERSKSKHGDLELLHIVSLTHDVLLPFPKQKMLSLVRETQTCLSCVRRNVPTQSLPLKPPNWTHGAVAHPPPPPEPPDRYVFSEASDSSISSACNRCKSETVSAVYRNCKPQIRPSLPPSAKPPHCSHHTATAAWRRDLIQVFILKFVPSQFNVMVRLFSVCFTECLSSRNWKFRNITKVACLIVTRNIDLIGLESSSKNSVAMTRNSCDSVPIETIFTTLAITEAKYVLTDQYCCIISADKCKCQFEFNNVADTPIILEKDAHGLSKAKAIPPLKHWINIAYHLLPHGFLGNSHKSCRFSKINIQGDFYGDCITSTAPYSFVGNTIFDSTKARDGTHESITWIASDIFGNDVILNFIMVHNDDVSYFKVVKQFARVPCGDLSNMIDLCEIGPWSLVDPTINWCKYSAALGHKPHNNSLYEDIIVYIYFYVDLDLLSPLNQKIMDCGACDSCLAFENTNLISTWMRHSGYKCCSNCCSWHRTVKLSLSTTKGSEDVPRRCSIVQENTQTEVVDSGNVIMRSVSTSLDNMSLTILIPLYQFEVLSSIILHCAHVWEWNFIRGTTVNAKQVMPPPTLRKIHNTSVTAKQFVKFVAIDIADVTGHMKKSNLGGVGYFLHTEGSLQFKQWDPGGYSLVHEKGSLDFNLEDKVVLKGKVL